MGNFFKTLGKGILYIFGLPLLVLFLAVYLVISIFGFIITGIKALILFFKGESITGKLPEDIEAEKRLELLLNPIPVIMEQVEQVKQQIANQANPQIANNPTQGEITQQPTPQIQQQATPTPTVVAQTETKIESTPIFDEEPSEVSQTKTVIFEEPISQVVSEDDIPTTEIDIKPEVKPQPQIDESYYEDDDDSSGVSFEAYEEDK